ncbi:MAG: M13 family metallopeptidase N-terminal domain-containing protein, partial [Opitutaceae bacterium]
MKRLPSAMVAIALTACATLVRAAESAPLADPAFSVKHMDLSVPPATDFAKFAAGGWYARTQMPSDKSRWGGFNELAERNWADLRAILEETAANPGEAGTLRQKVGDFFASATDVATINGLGVKPIAPDLAAIQNAKDLPELMKVSAQIQLRLGGPFFAISV